MRIFHRTWFTRSNVSSEKYPISRVCPKCGSAGYRLLGESITVAFGRDRECVNCSTRYAPRQSKAAGIVFILLGLFLAVPFAFATAHVILGVWRARPDDDFQPALDSALCPGIIALAGVWFLFHGLRAFRRLKHHSGSHSRDAKRPS